MARVKFDVRRPSVRPRHLILLAFLAVQLCDGALTYIGVRQWGSSAEGNPVVAWYIATLGTGWGLAVAKSLASACAVILHIFARHLTIVALTAGYVAFALVPWLHVIALAW